MKSTLAWRTWTTFSACGMLLVVQSWNGKNVSVCRFIYYFSSIKQPRLESTWLAYRLDARLSFSHADAGHGWSVNVPISRIGWLSAEHDRWSNDQWRNRLEPCIRAEWCHFEQLLWQDFYDFIHQWTDAESDISGSLCDSKLQSWPQDELLLGYGHFWVEQSNN